jgi:hypothetical protein
MTYESLCDIAVVISAGVVTAVDITGGNWVVEVALFVTVVSEAGVRVWEVGVCVMLW